MLRFYKKKKGYARYIVFYANLLVFLISAAYLGNYYYSGYQNRSKIDELNKLTDDVATPQVDEKGNVIDRYFGAVRDKYPYLVGRVSYHYYKKELQLPLMQTVDDPQYFLYRDVEENDSDAGTPFIDYRCDVQNSMILVMYAHNMKDLSQFGAIKLYKDEKYFKQYPTIVFESRYEEPAEYKIVAAFYSQVYNKDDKVFKYYNHFDLKTEAEYNDYIANVKKLARYDTGVNPKFGEKLILMSTCDYTQHLESGRFAVLAVKTDKSASSDGNFDFDKDKKPEESAKPADASTKPGASKAPATSKAPIATKKPIATKAPAVATKAPAVETKAPAVATAKPTIAPTKSPTKAPDAEATPQPTKEPLEETKEPDNPFDPFDRMN